MTNKWVQMEAKRWVFGSPVSAVTDIGLQSLVEISKQFSTDRAVRSKENGIEMGLALLLTTLRYHATDYLSSMFSSIAAFVTHSSKLKGWIYANNNVCRSLLQREIMHYAGGAILICVV